MPAAPLVSAVSKGGILSIGCRASWRRVRAEGLAQVAPRPRPSPQSVGSAVAACSWGPAGPFCAWLLGGTLPGCGGAAHGGFPGRVCWPLRPRLKPWSQAVVFWLRRAGTAGHHRCATGFQERPRLRGWGHGPLARGTRGRCGSSHTQALPLPLPPERAVTDAACSQERARPVLSIRDAWANGSTSRATAMPHPSRHLGDCLTSGTNTVCENTGLPLPRVLFAPRIRAGGPGGYRVYPP